MGLAAALVVDAYIIFIVVIILKLILININLIR